MHGVMLLLSLYLALGAAPGEPLPPEVRQQVDLAFDGLREAMLRKDADAVQRATQRLHMALGDWAAVPERAPVFRVKPDAADPWSRAAAVEVWNVLWPSALRDHPVPGPDHPEVRHSLLRHTAYLVMGGLAALRHGVGDPAEVRREVDRRLAYLLSVQRKEGFFPFPDLRGTSSPFAGVLESHYSRFPEDFADGWVVEDHGDGGLQFDNGVCAVTMIAAYEHLQEGRYLEAARRACSWTLTRPIVTNWNYNAFSVWAMARYTRVTNDRQFLPAAVERLNLGVLPGQLPGGRWMDPHNARTVYHAILLRAMVELLGVLPDAEAVRPRLLAASRAAERTLIDEILHHGPTDADHSLSALTAAQRVLGPDDSRARAIRVLAQAVRRHIAALPDERLLGDVSMFAVGELIELSAAAATSSAPG